MYNSPVLPAHDWRDAERCSIHQPPIRQPCPAIACRLRLFGAATQQGSVLRRELWQLDTGKPVGLPERKAESPDARSAAPQVSF